MRNILYFVIGAFLHLVVLGMPVRNTEEIILLIGDMILWPFVIIKLFIYPNLDRTSGAVVTIGGIALILYVAYLLSSGFLRGGRRPGDW